MSGRAGVDNYCGACGEDLRDERASGQLMHVCGVAVDADDEWCTDCGAELTDSGDCHNEHPYEDGD